MSTTLKNPGFTLECNQGVSKEFTVVIKDSAGAAIDLTDCSARLQARLTAASSGSALVDISSLNGDITVSGTAGTLVCTINAGDLLTALTGVYDLILYDANNIAFNRPLFGQFIVNETVTR